MDGGGLKGFDGCPKGIHRRSYFHFQWKAIELHDGTGEKGVLASIRSTGDDVVMAFCAATC